MSEYKWKTTVSSGRSKTNGADDGNTGWRLHLVDVTNLVGVDTYNRKHGSFTAQKGKSICGISPRYGWGIDLFVDEPCSRCLAIAEKHGIELPRIES